MAKSSKSKFDMKRIGGFVRSKDFWTNAGWAAVGAVATRAIPGIATMITKKDMSGPLAHTISTIGVSALFMGFNKPAVAFANVAINGVYLVQNYVNPLTASSTVGSPLILPVERNAFVNAATTATTDTGTMGDEIGGWTTQTVTLPSGEVRVATVPAVAGVNDYSSTPFGQVSEGVSDYSITPFGPATLNDNFLDMISQGHYFN